MAVVVILSVFVFGVEINRYTIILAKSMILTPVGLAMLFLKRLDNERNHEREESKKTPGSEGGGSPKTLDIERNGNLKIIAINELRNQNKKTKDGKSDRQL